MATYPDEVYNPVTDFYKKLPEGLKIKANDILSGFANDYKQGEAPPDEMLNSLKTLVAEQGDLESRVKKTSEQNGVSRVAVRIGKVAYYAIPTGLATLALYLL